LSGGDRWRARRKMLTPSFHFSMLQGYIECMNRHAKVLVEVLHDHIGQRIDADPFMKTFSMDVICTRLNLVQKVEIAREIKLKLQANLTLTYLGAKTNMCPHLWSTFGRPAISQLITFI
ncbi:hypothetical protein PMAYCL1PPCAC_22619, partial [Pristionchus mayeri]